MVNRDAADERLRAESTAQGSSVRTYQVRTYGCQMNVHDSERLSGLLEDAGYRRAPEGADADIVVWDPKARKTITAGKQQSVIDYNVFEGVEVTGLPKYVFTRGEVAVDNGKVQAKPGHGEFVAREPGMAVNKALSAWKELTAPRKVERTGIPASGV